MEKPEIKQSIESLIIAFDRLSFKGSELDLAHNIRTMMFYLQNALAKDMESSPVVESKGG